MVIFRHIHPLQVLCGNININKDVRGVRPYDRSNFLIGCPLDVLSIRQCSSRNERGRGVGRERILLYHAMGDYLAIQSITLIIVMARVIPKFNVGCNCHDRKHLSEVLSQ